STGGQTQILFLDQSAMTVGPNSDVTIDQFVYDPNTGAGQLAMSATQGVLRFVGGKLSKNENAVKLVTPSGSVSVRGGAFLANLDRNGQLRAIFIYGRELTVTGITGASQKIERPGYEVTIAGRGAPPSLPFQSP